MKNTLKKGGIEFLLISFFLTLLICSKEVIPLAAKGLMIWYQKMIPSLFPFMVLSGTLVKSGMADHFSKRLRPVIGSLFPLPGPMIYAVFMGFLCGFPMGAKVVCDLLESRQINLKQGQYLLSFCNNIGPLYVLGYVFPLFGITQGWQILLLLYGVPLSYGFCLQYFGDYRKDFRLGKGRDGSHLFAKPEEPLIAALFYGLENAITQITILGGCMVLFNCLLIYPKLFGILLPMDIQEEYQRLIYPLLCCLLEIGGGLIIMAENSLNSSFLIPVFLTFGGISCMMQTLFTIRGTGLSIANYLKHKFWQSLLILVLAILLLN